jgi:hypothetical protein
MTFKAISKLLHHKFLEVVEKSKIQFEDSAGEILVRKEEHYADLENQYLLEIINKNKINSDDYGIVVCVDISYNLNYLLLVVGTLKSYGPIINSKEFRFLEESSDSSIPIEVHNALAYLNNLPKELYGYVKSNF